jgi:hypothetical protein
MKSEREKTNRRERRNHSAGNRKGGPWALNTPGQAARVTGRPLQRLQCDSGMPHRGWVSALLITGTVAACGDSSSPCLRAKRYGR